MAGPTPNPKPNFSYNLHKTLSWLSLVCSTSAWECILRSGSDTKRPLLHSAPLGYQKCAQSSATMEVYDTGEIWEVDGDDLTYSYTKVILKKGDTFYYAMTSQRLGLAINIEELKPVRIPPQDIMPPYSADLTRAPTPLPGDCYIKFPSLLDCGFDLERTPAALVLAEARICEILRKVTHPNIANYYGCLTQGDVISGLCFTKYETTLAQLLQDENRPINPEIGDGIRSAIQHLHNLGFSHNDINPYNIMFKSDNTPMLIDFDSCARIGEKLGKTGGWEGQNFEFASQDNDYSALERIEGILRVRSKKQVQV